MINQKDFNSHDVKTLRKAHINLESHQEYLKLYCAKEPIGFYFLGGVGCLVLILSLWQLSIGGVMFSIFILAIPTYTIGRLKTDSIKIYAQKLVVIKSFRKRIFFKNEGNKIEIDSYSDTIQLRTQHVNEEYKGVGVSLVQNNKSHLLFEFTVDEPHLKSAKNIGDSIRGLINRNW